MSEHTINKSSMLKVGTIIHGVYRIERYLSSGGFGNTYVATNVEFDEVVAIKEFFIKGVTQRDANNTTVSVSNAENEEFFQGQMQKFKKEARRLRKLKNAHIVSVHDLFEENGTAYYVMDYIDGENLSVRVRRLQQPLSEREVIGYLPQILDALECVHKEGLWHLDLKPANIMVDRLGNVTLIDFGASKQRSNKGGATTSTAVSFTNGFAPREQMEQNLEKFGPWTDLYALGATLYNLLANKKPPMPSDIDDDRSADKHLALPLPASVSENARQLILRLMTTDRLDRPQSVEEVRKMMTMEGNGVEVAEPVEPMDAEDTLVAGRGDSTLVHPTPGKTEKGNQEHQQNVSPSENKPKKTWLNKYGIVAVAFLLVASVAAWFLSREKTSVVNEPAKEKIVKKGERVKNKKTVTAMPFKNALGDFTYTGEVNADNVPHGKGEATFKNGNYYKGAFVNGILDGDDCLFKFKNGDSFTGSFKNNYFNEGTYTVVETGEVFKGSFKNGNPSHGTWYDKKGKELEKI